VKFSERKLGRADTSLDRSKEKLSGLSHRRRALLSGRELRETLRRGRSS